MPALPHKARVAYRDVCEASQLQSPAHVLHLLYARTEWAKPAQHTHGKSETCQDCPAEPWGCAVVHGLPGMHRPPPQQRGGDAWAQMHCHN